MADIKDDIERHTAVKWAMASEAAERLKAMIYLARSEPGIPVDHDALDAHPWLLNCCNGTLNLKGQPTLQPHRREDLLTKCLDVDYDPEATWPQFDAFLRQIMCERQPLIDFLHRAIGYSLTGEVRERVLFIGYGNTGHNGKSTLMELLADLLGEYALRIPIQTLMVRRHETIPNDIAQLPGRRFVHASESEEGQRLAESFVKELTGRDTISARFIRSEWFTFRPVCKVWLRTNHKLVIRGTDGAIWDRIRLIPFDMKLDESKADTTLPQKLREELPGILACAVRGCSAWQTHGLGLSPEIEAANTQYLQEMDPLQGFIEDCCTLRPFAKTTTKALYDAYLQWVERNGEQPIPLRALISRLPERGVTPTRVGHNQARGWQGIGVEVVNNQGKS